MQDRGGRIVAEATGAGATSREYIWLDDMPIAVVADVDTSTPKLWFVHADHLDRPILMTDGAKASVWEAVWKPWGAPHGITGTASLDMRFPGQWFQAESGLHYNWHRQYDPTTGRYVQADPLGFVDGPNLYAYALSSPTQAVDADGRQVRGIPATPVLPPIPSLPSISIPSWWKMAGVMAGICPQLAWGPLLSEKNPPPGSKSIDETPWSGDHGAIKGALGLGGRDEVKISPDGDVWVKNPNGSWENAGNAADYTGSGKPRGRRGKDRWR